MMKRIISMAAIVLLALTFSSCGKSKAKDALVKEEVKVPVVVGKPARQTVTKYFDTTGTVYAEDESMLSFTMGGRIVKMLVDEGDSVEQGQLLAEIDNLMFQKTLSIANTGLDAAQDAIKAQEASLEVSRNQLEDAQNQYAKIETDYNRFIKLKEDGVVTPKEFQEMETAYKSAELRMNSAQEGVAASELQVTIAEGHADSAKAQVDQAGKSLRDTGLYAPFSGVIASKMAEPGETAGPGSPVFRLTGQGVKKLKLSIPEEFSGLVKVGDTVEIGLAYFPGEVISSTISRVTSDVSSESRAFSVEVPIPENYKALPGSFGTAKLVIEQIPDAITVPVSCLLSFEGEQIVFLNNNGIAAKRVVTVGIIEDKFAQILDGLTNDDEVVLVGNRFLNEGAHLDINTSQSGS